MVLTVHELLAMDLGAKAKHGNAEYIESSNTIRLYVYPVYEVDLDRCMTSQQAWDWILHVSKKKWCTGETLKSFIHCLNDACRLRDGKNAFEYFGTTNACTRRC